LDLEIALSGGPAKIQPPLLLQPGRRCVETPNHVIKALLHDRRHLCRALFSVNRSEAIKIASGKVAVVPASEDNGESCAKWTPAFSIAMDEFSEPPLNGSDGSR
jgi:hypothetical protein